MGLGWVRSVPGTRPAATAVRATVGELPVRDAVIRATSAPAALLRLRYEAAEAQRLLAHLGGPLRARVVTVVPTYRRPGLLDEAVQSALAQDIDDHLVLVIGDGEPPVVEVTDPRLRVIHTSRNARLPAIGRNLGMRITQAEFTAFLDDDNRWYPDHLARSLEALGRRPDALASYSGIDRVLADGRLVDTLAIPFDRRLLRNQNYVDANAIVVRRVHRAFLSRATRTAGRFPLEDWELAWRLSARTPLAFTGTVTVRYLINPSSHYWSDWAERAAAALDATAAMPTGPGGGPTEPV